MKKLFTIIFIIMMSVGICFADNIPSDYEGVWYLLSSSYDEGKTFKRYNPTLWMDIRGDEISMYNGEVVHIKDVFVRFVNGERFILVTMVERNAVWCLSKYEDQRFVLLQAFDKAVTKESVRMIFIIR